VTAKRTETELRQFFDRWATLANTFCRLYLGDSELAEQALQQGFLTYIRHGRPLRLDRLPAALMSLILDECDQIAIGEVDVESQFEAAVLSLLPQERSVFILHGVLGFQVPWIAVVTERSFSEISQLWVSSLVQLRIVIIRDTCSSLLGRRCPTVSNTSASA
jgi:DNA-directed RNA polymerase specialized sigma24 family protein